MSDLGLTDVESELSGFESLEDEDAIFFGASENPSPAPARRKKAGTKAGTLGITYRCIACQRNYQSIESYKEHHKHHIFALWMESAFLNTTLEVQFTRLAVPVLTEMQELKGDFGILPNVRNLATNILEIQEGDAVQSIIKRIASVVLKCIPRSHLDSVSAFHSKYVASKIKFIDSDECKIIFQMLLNIFPEEEMVLRWFFSHFLTHFFGKCEVLFCTIAREPNETPIANNSANKGDEVNDINFQRSVHYVVGSAVHRVVQEGVRAKLDVKWQKLVSVLRETFLTHGRDDEPPEAVVEWTRVRSRGGLKIVNESTYIFFMALCTSLHNLEKKDGSLLHAEVLAEVDNSSVLLLLWDEILAGSDVTEAESKFLRDKLCISFTNTFGNGISIRRMNKVPRAHRKKNKVALRPSLAR